MALLASAPPPTAFPVFIDTNLDTHLVLLVSHLHTTANLKENIQQEHAACFPNTGEVNVTAIRVKRRGIFYNLADSMLVRSAFVGIKGTWFLQVDLAVLKNRACVGDAVVKGAVKKMAVDGPAQMELSSGLADGFKGETLQRLINNGTGVEEKQLEPEEKLIEDTMLPEKQLEENSEERRVGKLRIELHKETKRQIDDVQGNDDMVNFQYMVEDMLATDQVEKENLETEHKMSEVDDDGYTSVVSMKDKKPKKKVKVSHDIHINDIEGSFKKERDKPKKHGDTSVSEEAEILHSNAYIEGASLPQSTGHAISEVTKETKLSRKRSRNKLSNKKQLDSNHVISEDQTSVEYPREVSQNSYQPDNHDSASFLDCKRDEKVEKEEAVNEILQVHDVLTEPIAPENAVKLDSEVPKDSAPLKRKPSNRSTKNIKEIGKDEHILKAEAVDDVSQVHDVLTEPIAPEDAVKLDSEVPKDSALLKRKPGKKSTHNIKEIEKDERIEKAKAVNKVSQMHDVLTEPIAPEDAVKLDSEVPKDSAPLKRKPGKKSTQNIKEIEKDGQIEKAKAVNKVSQVHDVLTEPIAPENVVKLDSEVPKDSAPLKRKPGKKTTKTIKEIEKDGQIPKDSVSQVHDVLTEPIAPENNVKLDSEVPKDSAPLKRKPSKKSTKTMKEIEKDKEIEKTKPSNEVLQVHDVLTELTALENAAKAESKVPKETAKRSKKSTKKSEVSAPVQSLDSQYPNGSMDAQVEVQMPAKLTGSTKASIVNVDATQVPRPAVAVQERELDLDASTDSTEETSAQRKRYKIAVRKVKGSRKGFSEVLDKSEKGDTTLVPSNSIFSGAINDNSEDEISNKEKHIKTLTDDSSMAIASDADTEDATTQDCRI